MLGWTVGAIDGTTVFVAGTKTVRMHDGNWRCMSRWPLFRLPLRGTPGDTAGLLPRTFHSSQAGIKHKRLRKACQRLEIPGLSPTFAAWLHCRSRWRRSDYAIARRGSWAMRPLRPPPATMPSGTHRERQGQAGRGGSHGSSPDPRRLANRLSDYPRTSAEFTSLLLA